MTNQQYTPGPWVLNDPCTDEIVADYGGNDISIATGIQNQANARLIAAAPELLEALIGAIDWEAERYASGSVPKWLADARAAIAKATGQ